MQFNCQQKMSPRSHKATKNTNKIPSCLSVLVAIPTHPNGIDV